MFRVLAPLNMKLAQQFISLLFTPDRDFDRGLASSSGPSGEP